MEELKTCGMPVFHSRLGSGTRGSITEYSMFFFVWDIRWKRSSESIGFREKSKLVLKSIKNCFFVILLKYFLKSFRFFKEFYRLVSI